MSQREFEIIESYFKRAGLCVASGSSDKSNSTTSSDNRQANLASHGIDIGIGDDCALLSLGPNQQIAMSMDILHAGVHFPVEASPEQIATRALAVNLSDLAAMGASPWCFTLGLSLPDYDENWLERFSQALLKMAAQYNCPLVGGDTTRAPLSLCLQVQGTLPRGQALTRSGAKLGDRIYVSGSLGNGAIALASLGVSTPLTEQLAIAIESIGDVDRQFLEQAFYNPTPRIELAQAVRPLANSAIDISDGLLGDLGHICSASKLGAKINVHQLPFSPAARRCTSETACVTAALAGGDDYELCLTVAQDRSEAFEVAASQTGVVVTCIGEMCSGQGVQCVDEKGQVVNLGLNAYSHF